jgi:polyisoprenoid-binding protein YceI
MIPPTGKTRSAQATNAVVQTAAVAEETVKEAATNVVAAVQAVAAPADRTGLVRYNAQPGGSKATVAGDSSIHAWTMESGVIGGFMEVDANFPESALTNAAAAKPVASVYVPVRSLKSGKTTMDERMQDTMSMTNYQRFEYRVIELKPKSQPGSTGALQFDAVGALTIVGKTITNTMPVTIEKKDGKIKVVGSTPLKLTQFEIKPPVISLPLLPDISVYDDLKLDFVWTLAPKLEKKP